MTRRDDLSLQPRVWRRSADDMEVDRRAGLQLEGGCGRLLQLLQL